MSRTRRLIFALTVMGVAILLASGLAMATTAGTDATDTKRKVTGTKGADTIEGTSGADKLKGTSGADEIHGLAGTDDINAGAGNDVIRSGPYDVDEDTVKGGRGDDTIYSADIPASKDVVGCGPGTDTVRADSSDKVAKDCENVEKVQEPELTMADGTYQLEPDPSAECDLGKGSFTVSTDPSTGERSVEVQFDKMRAPKDEDVACGVKIDPQDPVSTQGKGSGRASETVYKYKGKKPSQAKVDEMKEKAKQNAAEEPAPSSGDSATSKAASSGDFATAQSTWYLGNYYTFMYTEDVVGINVAESFHKLWWWYDYYDVDYHDRYSNCWEAYPSPLDVCCVD